MPLVPASGPGFCLMLFWGLAAVRAEVPVAAGSGHAECTFFGAARERHVEAALKAAGARRERPESLSALTRQVTAMRGKTSTGTRLRAFQGALQPGGIDSFIFADLQANGVQPASKATDWEFVRRVTLDLTGRIPTPERVLSFVADKSAGKRAALVEELLGSPQWVDKWTMYLGDVLQNTVTRPSSGINRFTNGRNAFYTWIRDSVASGKPYNKMAAELIAATGQNSYEQGELNMLVGSVVTNGPQQDVTDQQTADIAETFLGLSHVNCLLCHDGRGHLDSLSLWGKTASRNQMWQLASFLSHTTLVQNSRLDSEIRGCALL